MRVLLNGIAENLEDWVPRVGIERFSYYEPNKLCEWRSYAIKIDHYHYMGVYIFVEDEYLIMVNGSGMIISKIDLFTCKDLIGEIRKVLGR